MMTMVIARDGFFYPILTRIMDSCSPLNTNVLHFILEKTLEKDLQKILNTLKWHYNDVTNKRVASVRLT